jgi:selenide,water dikinase
MTDVTGFGLLGHLAEICRGSQLGARIAFETLPVIPAALPLAQQGFTTGAAARNWASYGQSVRLPPDLAPWQQTLLCDPQTSGGLLVTCAVEAVAEVMMLFRREGFGDAAIIGRMQPGDAVIVVEHAAERTVSA